jgi:diguanylate cyclase (GGDEF)-like protein
VDTQLEYDLLAILISVKTLEAETKLNNVRQTSAQLHRMVDDVEKSYLIRNGRVLNGQIKTTLEQYQSLVDIKAEYLLLAGRTRGRDSFIRNLISDLASGLEYQTQLIYRDILRSAEETSKQVTRQTHIVVSFSILTLLISLALVYVLYQRFVVRLVSLTEQVDAATASNVTTINVAGQDEISYLATVFSNYLSKVQKQELSLMEMSLSDPLTGIPNRRAFEANVKGAIDHAKRQQSFLSIVMVDIDFFKAYNDEYGHNQGDYCLQQVATALQETVARNTDFCARYGGEEFICVLPETDPAGAALKADQLHHAIKNLSISHAKSHASELLTLSIGVATFRFNEKKTWDVTTIVDEADKALYDAKNTGRNKTCFSFFV